MLGMSGQSNSVLDDIVGAFASVGRTLLAVLLAAVGLVVGVFLLQLSKEKPAMQHKGLCSA